MKQVVVEAGNGGDGCIAFEHLFCNAKGGPSGGNGGNGGHVIFQADRNTPDLSHVPSIVHGQSGSRGYGSNRHGANGTHCYLKVPIGTQIFLLDRWINGTWVNAHTTSQAPHSITCDGDLYVAARGGSGGNGNTFLTTSARTTGSTGAQSGKNAPLRVAERGAQGERGRFLLRMSQIAQLGLVGAPNAGKSTLLRRLTRARPKVAPYAFTTLKPHLGILLPASVQKPHAPSQCDEKLGSIPTDFIAESITIADLPGLIDGAAEHNKGLGAQFLSLISDCRVLAHLVDVGTAWVNARPYHNVNGKLEFFEEMIKQFSMLSHELTAFDHTLADPKRHMVIGTKMDLVFPEHVDSLTDGPDHDLSLWTSITDMVSDAACQVGIIEQKARHKVVLISARRGDNIATLVEQVQEKLREQTEVDHDASEE